MHCELSVAFANVRLQEFDSVTLDRRAHFDVFSLGHYVDRNSGLLPKIIDRGPNGPRGLQSARVRHRPFWGMTFGRLVRPGQKTPGSMPCIDDCSRDQGQIYSSVSDLRMRVPRERDSTPDRSSHQIPEQIFSRNICGAN
jgi:hypothetical protein